MIKLVRIVFLATLLHTQLYAQIDNRLLESHIEISDSNEEKIMLSIENRNFLKNNEYFGKIATGYTMMGTQLSTQMAYQAGKHVRLQGGVFLLSDFGNNTLRRVSPLLSLKMQKNGYSFLFGTLEGNFSHRLIEPIYNYERYVFHPIENGLQIKIDRPKLWSDTWINWEVMQYLNSNYQEQFSAGHSTRIKLIQKEKINLTLPVQGLVTHRGGQIDTIGLPLETMANVAVGFTLSYKPNQWIKEINTENYFTLYRNLSPTKTTAFSAGQGFLLNMTAITRYDIAASVGYWQGDQYISSRGGFLFRSVASEYGQQGYIDQTRSLLFFRLLYQKPIQKGLSVDVRFEPYYDLGNQLFEYSYSIYLTYKKDFSLINLMKRKSGN